MRAFFLLTTILTSPAWAGIGGNDRFDAGIDAERPSASYGGTSTTGGTASDVDHEGGNLTDRDREMIASLVNASWGTLISIHDNVATFQSSREDGYMRRNVQLEPPVSKPAPRPVARPTPPPSAPSFTPTTPAFDMGTISAPPLESAAWTPEPQPSVAPPEMNPPAAQLSLPEPVAPKRPGYANLEPTLRARIPVDTRLPGAKLRRPGEETAATIINAGIFAAIGAAFGAVPGGGKVYASGTPLGIIENAMLSVAAAESRRRRNGGVTPFDKDVRNLMNYNDRQIKELARSMEGNMTPRQVERFTEAFKKERRDYERHERKANQKEHGR